MTAILKNYGTSDKTLSEAEAGYLAGFLDGEGCLTIGRAHRKGYRSGHSYFAIMTLANTNLDALHHIAKLAGNGKIQLQDKRDRPEHKTLYRLFFGAGQIRKVLPQLQPYLLVKSRQAELLLDFLNIKESGRYRTDKYWHECEQLRAEIRGLNARGLTNTSAEDVTMRDRRVRVGSSCRMDGCDGPRYGQGYCYQHYYALVLKPKQDAAKIAKNKHIVCVICGKTFVSRRSQPASACSRRCRGRQYYLRNVERIKAVVAANKARKVAVK